jgi:HD-GYP domain-containing protein (c-di-GMP phosphodiesterase class II)
MSGTLSITEKINQLIDLGIALSDAKDLDKLLHRLLDGALSLSNADAGTIYLTTERNTLSFAIRSRSDDLPSFELPLYNEQGEPNNQYVSIYSAVSGKSVKIDDIYSDDENTQFNLKGTRKFDEETGYFSRSMVSIPMTDRDRKVIGVMQIVNAKDPETEALIPFTDEDIHLLESLASLAGVAVENARLFKAQRDLMDAFIQVLAGAIDAKSPYTGGHCSRVPEIANMLARAAVECNEGMFSDFHLNEEEWREFHIAGWLHDCGKVTTPEYVVDKDAKLSTIYNRIHEIRMRFEVLRRDAEIDYYRQLIENPQREAELKTELEARYRQLEEDYAFVAECNVGGEFMADEKIDRLQQIAAQSWVRNFDDRLGLSNMDLTAYAGIDPQPVPCSEKLLADKAEHIIERISIDNRDREALKTIMRTPEHLFNRGELYNLAIRKGTLTDEERFIINDHIVQTILMLKQLPLPDQLKRVPEIAGGHHETMIGTGYPLGLKREDLSISARIMAIADIFEALTASDRPYKKAKTIDESLKIMSFMVKDQHIDADLFRLFLESGVYKQYAERYLVNPQLGDVDINKYLN